jgi:hypothetical protein
MKALRYLVLSCGSFVLVAVAAVYVWQFWIEHHMFYPASSNETLFLRTYDPQSAIEPFNEHEGSSSGSSIVGSAGEKFVKHDREYHRVIAMRTDQWPALMTAVNDDLKAKLLQSGARILKFSGDANSSYHLAYAFDQSLGHVTIKPAKTVTIHRNTPLASGLEDAEIRIVINEKWFPTAHDKDQALAINP